MDKLFDLLTFSNQLSALILENDYLKGEVEQLRDYREKYIQLLNESVANIDRLTEKIVKYLAENMGRK